MEAAATLLGAINVFAVGFVSVNWVKWGDFAIIIVAGLSAFLLYLLSITGEIWVAYVGQNSNKCSVRVASFRDMLIGENTFALCFNFHPFYLLSGKASEPSILQDGD